MNILTIPLRNLRRKLPRTLLTLVVFTIGVASVTTLLELSKAVGESLEAKLASFGANILISPRTETLSVGYGGLALGDVSVDIKYLPQDAVTDAIRSIHHKDRISAVAPKFAVLIKIDALPVGVLGVDFPEELLIKGYWHTTSGELPQAANQILAGAAAADKLKLAPGSTVTVLGTAMTVSGVLGPTGGQDDGLLFTDLAGLQRAAGAENQIHFVEVAALCSGCPIDEITAQIAAKLPDTDIKAMQQVVKSRMMTVDFVKQLALTVSGVILLSACVMIGLSVFSSVNERKNEIGLLRALGYSKTAIFCLMDLEALLLGLTASLAGSLAGYAASFQFMALLDLGPGLAPRLDPAQCALMVAGITVLAALAALPPALAAARVEPSEALVML